MFANLSFLFFVKRSLDLRSSNFKFEFVFIFQPFDIRIQASLIRVDADGFALKVELCDDFFVLCRQSIQATPAACLLTFLFSSLPACHRGVQLLSILHCAPGACCKLLMQAIKVTNLGGPDTEHTSVDGNRVQHGLTSCLLHC